MFINLRCAVLAALLLAITPWSHAIAWDPNAGADILPPHRQTAPRSYRSKPMQPTYSRHAFAPVVQSRVVHVPMSASTYTAVQLAPLPAPVAAPAFTPPVPSYTPPPVMPEPAPVAAAVPVARQVPVQNPPPAYAAQPVSAPIMATEPAPSPYIAQQQSRSAPPVSGYDNEPIYPPPAMQPYVPPSDPNAGAYSGSAGLEYYHDNYQEDSLSLDNEATYFAATGALTYSQNHWFISGDTRVAYGWNDYSSPSGTLSDVPQWEFDTRVTAGIESRYGERGMFRPYIGLGNRYFRDELKGEITNLNAVGYDRRIVQWYLPVGVQYRYTGPSGWHYNPTLEYMHLLYGNVSSRLRGTGLGLENVENRQKSGFGGIRGEFMIGQRTASGNGFEFGPFVRYWDIDDSELENDSLGNTWQEPANTRLQLGATVRYLF